MTDGKRLVTVIRDAVLDTGKTQRQIADELDLERKAVCNWVNGRSVPTALHLVALMKMTSDPEWFMGRLVAK